MNYYEKHIGDYLKDTTHLSLLEHGIYSRLLDIYYTREEPIPEAQVMRLVGARTDEERSAVRDVLTEFFVRDGDMHRHGRCDREIARYQEKQRKASASANARWNKAEPHSEGNATAMRTHSEGNAHHTPDTSNQTPVTSNTHTPPPTEAARVCGLMRKTGMADVSPGHPDLLALVAAGATDAEFEHAATQAGERGKGFVYALGMLKRQRSEASALTLHQGPLPAKVSAREQAKGERIYNMTGGLMGIAPAAKKEFIDAEPSSRPALG